MRERLMRADRTAVVDGTIVIKNESGVIVRTSSALDAPDRQDVFDINLTRLAGIQQLILHRYGGPCDCDGDADLYLSAAFNALACSMRLKRQKASLVRLLNWMREWVPVADPETTALLAERVIARPRYIRASTLGSMLRLSTCEHRSLHLKGIYPCDDATFALRKAREKAERDRQTKRRRRREAGARPLSEIIQHSDKAFCERHNIALRSFMRHKAKGPAALSAYLCKKGVSEKWHWDGALIDEGNPLMQRHPSAKIYTPPHSSISNRLAGGAKSPPAPAETKDRIMKKSLEVGRAAMMFSLSALRSVPADFAEKLDQSASLDGRLAVVEATTGHAIKGKESL